MSDALIFAGMVFAALLVLILTVTKPSGIPGWWQTNTGAMTGVAAFIDIAAVVNDANGFLDAANAQADKVHLTPGGYSLVGAHIASSLDETG